MRPPDLTAPHPPSPELLRAVLRPREKLKPPPFIASGALPLRHPSFTGEHIPSTAYSAHAQRAGETPLRPLSAVHRGPTLSAVHRTVDSVHGIFR
jgi:hypothetical protein